MKYVFETLTVWTNNGLVLCHVLLTVITINLFRDYFKPYLWIFIIL
nr:MAG TPA: hypothetical protein [Caudoviricetes sp.]